MHHKIQLNARLLAAAIVTVVAMTAEAQQQAMRLVYDRPANYFEESLPIGNGRLGALVYGGYDRNIICLNDITFWTGKPVDRDMDKDAGSWIPKIRKALSASSLLIPHMPFPLGMRKMLLP